MMHKKIMPTFADAMPSLYAGRLPTPDNICSLSNHQQCRIRILFASAMIVTSSIPMMGDAYYIMPTSRRLRARRSTAPVSFSNFEVQKSTSTPYGVHNSHYVHGIYSSDGDPMFASMIPDAHSLAHPALYSISRSTSNPEEGVGGAVFVNGREERRAKLHTELSKLGIDGNEIENHPERFGTAAIRTYNSFLLPKSAGALAVAESPTRPRVVANNFSFLVREFKADQERWLRNVDQNRSKEPKGVTSENGKHPITIILDNIRSAHNVGNILRLAEAAQIDSVRLCGMTPRPPHPKV